MILPIPICAGEPQASKRGYARRALRKMIRLLALPFLTKGSEPDEIREQSEFSPSNDSRHRPVG